MNSSGSFLPRARRSWVGALFALGLTASLSAAGPLSAWRGHPAYELYRAIGVGDSNTFLRLLTADTNLIHQPLVTDQLPLYQAAERGRLFMVEWLLAHGADPNAVRDQQSPHDQLTPLRGAAGHGHFEICKRLLQAGAAVDRRQTTVQGSPLYFAIGAQSEEIAALLLDHGANPFHAIKQTLSAPTPIELAILRANGLLVPRMLAEADSGAKAKFLARRGPALLRAAAVRGQLAAVKALLAEGISPEMADRNEAESSLLQAIASWTATALHQASDSPQPALLERARRWTELRDLLIQHGAKYDVLAATGMGDEKTVDRLLAENPDSPRARDALGNTPLYWSVRGDWLRLTIFWIENGAVPAATNRAGQTPLHLAIASLRTRQVALLLAADSRRTCPTPTG